MNTISEKDRAHMQIQALGKPGSEYVLGNGSDVGVQRVPFQYTSVPMQVFWGVGNNYTTSVNNYQCIPSSRIREDHVL